jgi:hypothetical protein
VMHFELMGGLRLMLDLIRLLCSHISWRGVLVLMISLEVWKIVELFWSMCVSCLVTTLEIEKH